MQHAVEIESTYSSLEQALSRAFGCPSAHIGQSLEPRVGVMRTGSSTTSSERIAQDGMTRGMLFREMHETHYALLHILYGDESESPGVYALHAVTVALAMRDLHQHIDARFARHFSIPRWLEKTAKHTGFIVQWAELLDVPDATLGRWNATVKRSLDAVRADAEIRADEILRKAKLIA